MNEKVIRWGWRVALVMLIVLSVMALLRVGGEYF